MARSLVNPSCRQQPLAGQIGNMKQTSYLLTVIVLAAFPAGCSQDPVPVGLSEESTYSDLIVRHEIIDPAGNHNRVEIDQNKSMVITVNKVIKPSGAVQHEAVYSLRHRLPSETGSKTVRDVNFGDVFVNGYRLNRYHNILVLPDSLGSGKPDTIEYTSYYSKFNLTEGAGPLSTSLFFRSTGSPMTAATTQTLALPEPVTISNLPQDALIEPDQSLTLTFNQTLYAGLSGLYLYPAGTEIKDGPAADTAAVSYLYTDMRPTQATRSVTIPPQVLQNMVTAFRARYRDSVIRFVIIVYGVQTTAATGLQSAGPNGEVYSTPVHLVSNYSATIRLNAQTKSVNP